MTAIEECCKKLFAEPELLPKATLLFDDSSIQGVASLDEERKRGRFWPGGKKELDRVIPSAQLTIEGITTTVSNISKCDSSIQGHWHFDIK